MTAPAKSPAEHTPTDVRFVNCETCQSEGRILTSDGGPDDKDHGVCPECNGLGVVEVEVQPVTLNDLPPTQPSTAEQIVDLIRADHPKYFSRHAITTAEAIDLIEQYAAVVAAEAATNATAEAHDRTMAAFDAALSRPLATTARTSAERTGM